MALLRGAGGNGTGQEVGWWWRQAELDSGGQNCEELAKDEHVTYHATYRWEGNFIQNALKQTVLEICALSKVLAN